MNNVGLWDLFNIERPKEDEKKVKKTKAPANGKKTANATVYELPMTIHTLTYESYTMEKDGDKDKVTKDELLAAVALKFPDFPVEMTDAVVNSKEHSAFIFYKKSKQMEKGTLKLSAASICMRGNCKYDLSTVMTDAECNVPLQEIAEVVAKAENVKSTQVGFYVHENIIVPYIHGLSLISAKFEFPVKVNVFGREIFQITEQDYADYLKSSSEFKDDGAEIKANEKGIRDFVSRKYPELKMYLSFTYVNELSSVFVTLELQQHTTEAKKVTIPTDYTVSLIFNRIALEPSFFDGADEISESDLIKWLSADYPEYTKERTELIIDKKKKLVIPQIKGSKRGAYEVVKDEERLAELLHSNFARFVVERDNVSFLTEVNPFSVISADCSGNGTGEIFYKLPKIPAAFFHTASNFFAYISKKYNTEALLQIYWLPEEERYIMECPNQKVTHVSVDTDEIQTAGNKWLVCDLHSHGRINCSFSGTDNRNQLITGFYGVFYHYEDGRMQEFDLRAGCAGKFVNLSDISVVFSGENRGDDLGCNIDFSEWEKALEV